MKRNLGKGIFDFQNYQRGNSYLVRNNNRIVEGKF